jgi:2-dehydropantoate 2-reductase
VLESAPGLGAEIRTDMDAWLKYHVALLMPSIAPALYMSGTDNERFARTRDALVLALRAIREGFRVLRALGYPVTPARLRILTWIPEPVLVAITRRLMANPRMKIALVGHAEAARDEIQHLADEFLLLAEQAAVPVPTICHLYRSFDPHAPLMADGSKELPLDWSGVLLAAGAVGAAAAAGVGLARRSRARRRTAPR